MYISPNKAFFNHDMFCGCECFKLISFASTSQDLYPAILSPLSSLR